MCNKTEVAVGLSISLTGKCRPLGQQALQGIRLWQSYINAQGGIAVRNGEKRSVRLIWYDDRSQISLARKNVFQLLQKDQIDILLGPYSSSLTMAVAEIAEEHTALRRICVLYSAGGTFGWQVARGILESVLVVAGQSVELAPLNSSVENYDTTLRTLFDIDPEVVVLAVTFPDELGIMRTRQHWPSTVRVVAAVAAGLGDFSAELAQIADGVLGPSQWEPRVTFPSIVGPTSDWFLDSFHRQFGHGAQLHCGRKFCDRIAFDGMRLEGGFLG